MRPSSLRRFARIASLVLLAALAGCAAPGAVPPSDPGAPVSSDPAFDARAAEIAAAWTAPGLAEAWRGGFIPLQDLTVLLGEPTFTDDTKAAYGNGWFTFRGTPPPAPGPGRITYPDGTSTSVPLQAASDAFDQLNTHAGECVRTAAGDCLTLVATSATLDQITLRTSRGEARVPAWVFAVEGIGAKVARVAVAPSAIAPLPSPAVRPLGPTSFIGASALVSTTGTSISYQVTFGSCDTGIAPLVYEDDRVVVLGATVTRTKVDVCDLVAHVETLTAELRTPVGHRLVLDVANGDVLQPSLVD